MLPSHASPTGGPPACGGGRCPHSAYRVRWAALVAAVAGILGALAFPSAGIWPLAFVSVAGLSVAVDGRRSRTGAWLGLLYGVGFFGPLLHWTGVYVGAVPWLVLAVFEAVFFAGLGALLPVLQRLPGSPVWIASAWVLQEFLRDRLPFGGFPWGRLAFSQATSPLKWFAALGGAPLVTFMVALTGALMAAAVPHAWTMRWQPLASYVAGAVAVLLLGILIAFPLAIDGTAHEGNYPTVALIQGSVPVRGLAFEDRAEQVLDNHIAQTMKLAAEVKAGTVKRPELVVWPEDASDVDPFQNKSAFDEIDATVKAMGAPILVGAILQGPGNHRRNAGILWSPTTGPGAQYIKRHPVPFGEYIPLRSLAEWVSSDAKLVSQDMVGGGGNGLVKGGPFPIGDVICFEVAYDSLVRSSVKAGAQMLVVQTNNATFGHTDETYQQLAMSQLRAVETGRTVLQVATTGKSAMINPDGDIEQQSGALFTPAILVAQVKPETGTTLAVSLGAVPEYLFALLAAAATGWGLWRSRRRSEPEAEPADNDEEVVTT
jgi:apolipoprotein N-acyltransferase